MLVNDGRTRIQTMCQIIRFFFPVLETRICPRSWCLIGLSAESTLKSEAVASRIVTPAVQLYCTCRTNSFVLLVVASVAQLNGFSHFSTNGTLDNCWHYVWAAAYFILWFVWWCCEKNCCQILTPKNGYIRRATSDIQCQTALLNSRRRWTMNSCKR
jgi:hypothetical protein